MRTRILREDKAVGLDRWQVWEKNGQHYLTLGLYVDLNEDNLSAADLADGVLPMADDPAFVLPDRVPTADIFADKVRPPHNRVCDQ